MTNHSPASSEPFNMKALAAAILLCVAGSAHSPSVQASGIPTFDATNILQMIKDFSTEKAKTCFTAQSFKETMDQIQDIQRIIRRTRAGMNMSELMPERDLLDGIEACPSATAGGLAGSAASVVRGALGMGNVRLDGSTDLRALQTQLCMTEVILKNQKWNEERTQLNEAETQLSDYQDIMNRWNGLVDGKGSSALNCVFSAPGSVSVDVTPGGASEGKQTSFEQEIAQVAADNARALEEARAKVATLDGAIASVRSKQAEVGQMMLNGESGSVLGDLAGATVRTALLKTALDNARSD